MTRRVAAVSVLGMLALAGRAGTVEGKPGTAASTIAGCDMDRHALGALTLALGPQDYALTLMRDAASRGCVPAQLMMEHADLVAQGKGGESPLAALTQRRWAGAITLPGGPTFLYDGFVVFMSAFPDEVDKALADWITKTALRLPAGRDIAQWTKEEAVRALTSGDPVVLRQFAGSYLKLNPILPLEAARRYVSVDINKALYWMEAGNARLVFLVYQAGGPDFGMGDIIKVWQQYAGNPLAAAVNDGKTLASRDRKARQKVLRDLDVVIPPVSSEDFMKKSDSPEEMRAMIKYMESRKKVEDLLKSGT